MHNNKVLIYLVLGYLQLANAEKDIERATFRAGSSALYKLTVMTFGLSNAG